MRAGTKKIFYFLIISLVFGCETKRQFTSKPSKSIVNPDSDLIEVNVVAYHVNDSATLAFVEIVNENLIYKRPDTTAAFYAELKVSYTLLMADHNNRKIIDSGSIYMNDRAMESVSVKSLKTMFNIKARSGNDYYLDIQVFDLNKKIKYSKGINIYKRNAFTSQNFLVNVNNNVPFTNHFTSGEVVSVQLKNKNISEVTVDCYFKDFPIPPPPFSLKQPDEFKYKPDSTFTLRLTSDEFSLTMPPKGFYHVRMDKSGMEGLTLHTYDKTFPGVSNTDEMINCTRYIMNREEFEQCKNAADQKEAIDKFWLSIGGSNERARELLKRYYGRVKEANKYYSSYTQGWKTDRGMVFIMFGLPSNIHRTNKSETWTYGVETNPNTIRYVFQKTKNPFSDNDYVLERSQFFKDPWYTAEDVWRNGHVYLNQDK